jgi:putative sigma-54 modulation protein
MRLQVKGKNVEVTPSIREYAERKLAKLGKQLAEQTQVEVELSEQRNPSIAESQVAEATVFTKGPTLRAREASSDMKASIDQLVDKLERQVKRYRERRTVEPRRHTEHNGVEPRGVESRGVESRSAEPRDGEQRGDSA